MRPHFLVVPLLLLLLFSKVAWAQADHNVGVPTSLQAMRALQGLASPLSPYATITLLSLSQRGNLEFCSTNVESAQIYCANKARIRGSGVGLGTGVCILLLFNYNYRGQTCSGSLINTKDQATLLSSTTFFAPISLASGKILHFPKIESFDEQNKARFLPHSIALSLKFDAPHLKELMKIYGVSQGSYMESYMNSTLSQCSLPPSPHETKACYASLESMVAFIGNTLGENAITIKPPKLPNVKAQIVKANFINDENQKVISCHVMEFPSLIYSCHMAPRSQVVNVFLRLVDGTTTRGMAICHLDTSYWSPNHVVFKALHTKPGKGTICHWLPHTSFTFVQRSPL